MATEFISLSAKDTLDNFTGELRDKLDKAARAGCYKHYKRQSKV